MATTIFESRNSLGRRVVDGDSPRNSKFERCELPYLGSPMPSIVGCQSNVAAKIRLQGTLSQSPALAQLVASDRLTALVQKLSAPFPMPEKPQYTGPSELAASEQNDARHRQLNESSELEWFRFFKQREHAEDFAKGLVRISTLNACRGYEKVGQGDKGEGTLLYTHGPLSYGDAGFDTVTSRLGISASVPGCSISGNRAITYVPDAYVLCCTRKFDPAKLGPTFGRYCVRIRYPLFAFQLLDAAIIQRHEIESSFAGHIVYSDRTYRDLEPQPAVHPALLKPRDGYAAQREGRMVWQPKYATAGLKIFDIAVPSLSALCERIA